MHRAAREMIAIEKRAENCGREASQGVCHARPSAAAAERERLNCFVRGEHRVMHAGAP
jgi:hypothetical protein